MTPVVLGIGAVAVAIGLLVLAVAGRTPSVGIDRLDVAGTRTAGGRLTGTAVDSVALAERVLHRLDPRGRLAAALEKAGSMTAAADVLVVTAVGALVGFAIGAVLGGAVLGLLLAALAPVGTRVWLTVRTDRRQRAFAEQLDDAMQLMASSLRAGHSLLRAVDAVSRDTQAPMSVEFARVVNEVRVGRDMNDALVEVADRTASQDFRWVVQAIGVHREVGGNLAEVLDRVGETIRERSQLFRQARALSAEGRTSGLVLLVMPFAVAGLIGITSPAYLTPLFTTVTGYVLVGGALTLMAIGALWLRSIVKVRF